MLQQTRRAIEEQVCRLYRAGRPYDEIRRMSGLSRVTVYRMLIRNGVLMKGRGRPPKSPTRNHALLREWMLAATEDRESVAHKFGYANKRSASTAVCAFMRTQRSIPLER